MKLRRDAGLEGRKRRLRTAEVAGRSEQVDPGLEFDAKKVIEKEIWDRVDRCLNAHRDTRPSDELAFLRLAVFDLERRLRAEQDDELPAQIQLAIFNVARHEVDPDIAVNTELAKYIDLFPEVMSGLDEPLAPTPHDLDKSLASFDGYSRIDHDIELLAPRMRALVQLFPEQQDLIFQKIEQLHFFEKAMKGAQELSQVPGEALNHLPAVLANLAVIFPERKEDILEIIRPRWNILQARLKAWGNLLNMELDDPDPDQRPLSPAVITYVDNVLGMAYLANLSQSKSLSASPKLPERLVT